MPRFILAVAFVLTGFILVGCKRDEPAKEVSSSTSAPTDHGHTHAPGEGDDHEHTPENATDDADDHHDEEELESVEIGGMTVEFAQGHGPVQAGVEGHLVVKLPYNDNGATVVRAWIGMEDRTLSLVGLGEYAPSHNDYDIHAIAPSPLPEGVLWWVEISKPDGTSVVGSVTPILE